MSDELESRILTVTHHNLDGTKDRVTIGPDKLNMVVAEEELVNVMGALLKKTRLHFTDGTLVQELRVTEYDLTCLEQAVGIYFL